MDIDIHADLENAVAELECPKCSGFGQCEDAEPGDIGFNTWTCPDCKGTGIKDGKQYKIVDA